jgi:2'-5' RNA ligase
MKKRIFLGLILPEDVISHLKKYYDHSLPVRWTRPENLHVTLNFLGDVAEERLADAYKICESVCVRHPKFRLTFEKAVSRRYMVWATLKKSGELEKLHNELAAEFMRMGLEQNPGRNFRPHVNLARARGQDDIVSFRPEELSHINFLVSHVAVFESILKPEGPTYISLDSFELKGSDQGL